MIKKDSERIIVTLDIKHLVMLSKVNDLIGSKQNSKSIIFLLDYFFQVSKNE